MTKVECNLVCDKCRRRMIIHTNKKGLKELSKNVGNCSCGEQYALFSRGRRIV